MRMFRSIVVLFALAGGDASLAQAPQPVPPAARQALAILTHLDLDSFPNSTGPRRRPGAHIPADYGLARIESFPDGWAQVSEPDDGWHMGALLLEHGATVATICFTDSAGDGGTYRATQVLQVRRNSQAGWTASEMPDRSDCKNVPAFSAIHAAAVGPGRAEILQHLDDFRDGLPRSDRHSLDQILRRSPDGGIAQCDRSEGSRASCEVAAYLPALHRAGLMPRFLASPGPVPSAQGLLDTIRRTGAAATAASLSSTDWDVALDAAAAGRADWIDVIARLRATTDAGRSEAIDRALSDALLTNPSPVLRMIVTRHDLPGAVSYCQDRSIEPTAIEIEKHDAAAMAAVARVTEPGLEGVRDRCLASFKLR